MFPVSFKTGNTFYNIYSSYIILYYNTIQYNILLYIINTRRALDELIHERVRWVHGSIHERGPWVDRAGD
jgi:hypothetical protein